MNERREHELSQESPKASSNRIIRYFDVQDIAPPQLELVVPVLRMSPILLLLAVVHDLKVGFAIRSVMLFEVLVSFRMSFRVQLYPRVSAEVVTFVICRCTVISTILPAMHTQTTA